MLRKGVASRDADSARDLAALVDLDWNRLEGIALRGTNAVKLMTSFGVKGTEYEVVFLPHLNVARWPYEKKGTTVDWEEARRVFYVALTRAKQKVVLYRTADRNASSLLEPVLPFVTGPA